MTVHSFVRRARDSDRPEVRARAEEVLATKIEARAFHWTDAGGSDDKRGVDVWALLPNGKQAGVDVKDNTWGEVRLEYVSRVAEGVVGWTVKDTSITDYVLNLWPRYFWLIDFPSLKAVAKAQEQNYLKWYGLKGAQSSGNGGHEWRTSFVPVPVGRLLFDIYGQTVLRTPLTPPRLCPSCHQEHPVGTTCAEGWAPWDGFLP